MRTPRVKRAAGRGVSTHHGSKHQHRGHLLQADRSTSEQAIGKKKRGIKLLRDTEGLENCLKLVTSNRYHINVVHAYLTEAIVNDDVSVVQKIITWNSYQLGNRLFEFSDLPSPMADLVPSPLHLAASLGRPAIVDMLIKTGVGARSGFPPDECFLSPSELAYLFGRQGSLQRLRESGGSTDYIPEMLAYSSQPLEQISSLLVAIIVDDDDGAGRLMDSLVTPDGVRDARGRTALAYAALLGRGLIARLLVASGADVNSADDNGLTPLWLASFAGHHSLVRMLLEAGAARGLTNTGPHENITLLQVAIMSQDAELLRVLLTRLTPTIIDIISACMFGTVPALRLLLANCPKLVNETFLGETPLDWAVRYGRQEMIDILFGSGADMEKCHVDGERRALHLAISYGRECCLKKLFVCGANADAHMGNDPLICRPLHLTAELNAPHCARILIDAGAQRDVINSLGNTEARHARTEGSLAGVECINVLEKYGRPVIALKLLTLAMIRKSLRLPLRKAVDLLRLSSELKAALLFHT